MSQAVTVDEARKLVGQWLAELGELEPVPGAHGKPVGVQVEPGTRPGEFVVQLPGSVRLLVPISVLVGGKSVEVSAFVCRNPEEHHEEVFRWLLSRNARMRMVAFALDRLGDIFVQGRLPVQQLTAESFDELLGEALDVADRSFNEIISRGFASSVRAEYAWRVSRGLSTRNLDAFSHLIDAEPDETPDESAPSRPPSEPRSEGPPTPS
ncbi:MAG: YbjN domain-containing protein [Actinomycetales bacterium]